MIVLTDLLVKMSRHEITVSAVFPKPIIFRFSFADINVLELTTHGSAQFLDHLKYVNRVW